MGKYGNSGVRRLWLLYGVLAVTLVSATLILLISPAAKATGQSGRITGTDCQFRANTPHISTHYRYAMKKRKANATATIECRSGKARIWIESELQKRPLLGRTWTTVGRHEFNNWRGEPNRARSYAGRACDTYQLNDYRLKAFGTVVTTDGREYKKKERISYEEKLSCGQ